MLLTLVTGGLNWASIGLLQYDFIAGFFGTQASIFSRLFYIAFGISAVWFVFSLLKNKGTVSAFKNKNVQPKNDQTYNNDILS